ALHPHARGLARPSHGAREGGAVQLVAPPGEGRLVWGLGAMAAERVFYGETSMGVGGDVQSVTTAAGFMVGAASMGPEPLDLDGKRDEVMPRLEEIGTRIMARTGAGGPADVEHNPVGAVFADPRTAPP